jgi:hypothetical protein
MWIPKSQKEIGAKAGATNAGKDKREDLPSQTKAEPGALALIQSQKLRTELQRSAQPKMKQMTPNRSRQVKHRSRRLVTCDPPTGEESAIIHTALPPSGNRKTISSYRKLLKQTKIEMGGERTPNNLQEEEHEAEP